MPEVSISATPSVAMLPWPIQTELKFAKIEDLERARTGALPVGPVGIFKLAGLGGGT
ncbi:hypothetical protein [Paracoccus ravus]|uniref:hypothetical protein n=1 Tax=Paracoccus ravus TaxID=2447760 RepID=UPI0014309665|nr:hypothetical protein [Paracoccus ravus]